MPARGDDGPGPVNATVAALGHRLRAPLSAGFTVMRTRCPTRKLGNVGAKYPFEGSDRSAGIKPNSSHGDNSRLSCETQLPMPRRQRFLTMRLNIWVILAALLATR